MIFNMIVMTITGIFMANDYLLIYTLDVANNNVNFHCLCDEREYSY